MFVPLSPVFGLPHYFRENKYMHGIFYLLGTKTIGNTWLVRIRVER